MNAQRYRLVFNRTRGALMAVAETTAARGKDAGSPAGITVPASNPPADPPADSFAGRHRRPIALSLLIAFGAQCVVPPAAAQIVAYRTAPASQRPTVLNAGNGVPLVNIQTPSAAGVSRNTYEQFDVAAQGAILNNSRTNVQTQLGGWIQGNPWLAAGGARVILNEVISANPSQLLGFVEVAGTPAQVVIANPAGVTCNGCGFINASRATLTTGTPLLNGGNLDGYRVEGGTIRIEGTGMDASRAGYTDLIARAVEINAGLWAQTLKVAAGINVVAADNTSATPIAGSSNAPAFAIDVAQLGGMYAGKITLVGTEAGVGVRNAGQIGAGVGEVAVTTDGQLINSGSISSANGNMNLNATTFINNGGQISAGQKITANIAGQLTNTAGQIVAGTGLALTAASLNNTGGTLGALGGQIVAYIGGPLDNTSGAIQATGDLTITTSSSVDNTGGFLYSNQSLSLTATSLNNSATQGNTQGIAGRTVDLTTQDIDNRSGAIRADSGLAIHSSGTLDNTQGLVSSAQALAVHDGNASKSLAIANTGGTFIAGQALSIDAASLTGSGRLLAYGDLALKLSSQYTNHNELTAGGNLLLETVGAFNNAAAIRTNGSFNLTATAIDNAATGEISASDLHLTAGTLNNRGLIDGENVRIEADTLNNLGAGRLYGDTLAIQAGLLNNETEGGTAPVIAARDRLDLGVGTLNNGEGALILSAGDLAIGGALDANNRATGQATAIINTSATIEALGNLTIDTASLTNQKARFATQRTTGADLPTGVDLLAYTPETAFHWPVGESNITTWRNYIRDRYINLVAKLLGGGPPADWVALYNPPPDPNADPNVPPDPEAAQQQAIFFDLFLRTTGFANVWGDLTGYTGPIGGGGLTAAYRAELAAAVNSLGPVAFEHSLDLWNFLIAKIGADHPEYIATMAQSLAGQSFPLRSYNQHCVDPYDDCSYVQESVTTRSDSRDIITVNSPSGIIRAGGQATIHADTLTNRYSFIQSGGDMQLSGTTLTNVGTELYRYSDTTTSTTLWHWANRHKGTTVGASSTQTLIGSAPSVISAGGDLAGSYSGLIDNQTIRQNAAPVVPAGDAAPAALTIASIGQPAEGSSNGSAPIIPLPANSLLHTNPDPNARFLIESDPQFTNYRQWLSSDYMLQAFAADPVTAQKRLGDGFYEQRLITEQVAQLTGRRFLEGYANDEAQYRGLMDAGLTFASAHQLRPGVSLSAEQMAALTSDIVWLVQQTVTLSDGSTQRVLVPQVYVRLRDGDLTPSGALIAADNLHLETTGDLVTSGTVAGRQIVSLQAENLVNLRGRIVGQDIQAQATKDLTILGGTIEAERSLAVSAGNDLTVASSTVDHQYQVAGLGFKGSVNRTDIDRVAGLYVTGAGGTLVASAGHDLNLLGAAIVNASGDGAPGSTTLLAGHDLNLGTVTESHTAGTQSRYGGRSGRWNEAAYAEVGSFIQSQGDLTLLAGNDLSARATTATSGGALTANAGRDLSIVAGEAGYAMELYRKSSQGGSLSKRTSATEQAFSSTTALSSTFSGDSVTLQAGRDARVTGSAVLAEQDLAISAGRDVLLDSAESTQESHFRHSSTKSQGLGKRGEMRSLDTLSVRQTGATLSGRNIDVSAGNDLTLVGTQVKATGDVTFTAGGEIAYLAAAEFEESRSARKKTNNLLGFENFSLLYDNLWQQKKQKGETTKSSRTAAVTRIETPGNVLSVSGGDTTLAGTQVRAGSFTAVAGLVGDSIDPTAKIHLLGVKESDSYSETREGRSTAWQSSKSEGHTIETLVLPDFQAYGAKEDAPRIGIDGPVGGNQPNGAPMGDGDAPTGDAIVPEPVASLSPTLIAPGGVVVGATDLPATQAEAARAGQGGGGGGKPPPTVAVDLQAQAKALAEQPGLAWLGELAERDDVDWQKVALIHDQWDYKHSGLTQEGAAIIAIVIAIVSWGTMTEAGVALVQAAELSTAAGTVGGALATATAAGLSALASQAAVGLVNNQGDIGQTLKDLGDSDSIKQIVTAMLTAGALNAVGGTEWMQTFSGNATITERLVNQMVNSVVSATVYTAIEGGSYADNLGDALRIGGVNALAGWAASGIGDWYTDLNNDMAGKYLAHKVAHALLGCAGAEAKGGSCATGAIGGAVGEAFAEMYGDLGGKTTTDVERNRLIQLSSLVAMAAAKASGKDIYAAGDAAAIAVVNNFLTHQEASERLRLKDEKAACQDDACRASKQQAIDRLDHIDGWRDQQLNEACRTPSSAACKSWAAAIQIAAKSYQGQYGNLVDTAERASVLNQAYKYQQAVNDPFRYGVGVGLLKLTPPGLVVGAVGAIGATLNSLIEQGTAQTLIDIANGLSDLPSELKTRLNSSDPAIRGEALVDVASLATVGVLISGGAVKLTLNSAQKASLASAFEKAEAEAIAKAKIELNLYRDWPVAEDMVQYRVTQLAERATHNSASDTVVLGKYVEGSASSYEQIAKAQGATYFELPGKSWSQAELQLGSDNMWAINKQFLEVQVSQGKSFIFTTNPTAPDAGHFTRLEYKYLADQGYQIFKDGEIYRAIKK